MDLHISSPRPRGRPPKQRTERVSTRDLLLRAGLESLTEKGFSAVGLDEILKRADVPKGSFYHYFSSKEAFGLALIEDYRRFFAHKLDKHLLNHALSPLERLRTFIGDVKAGMARFNFRRGCLIGNLGQEMGSLPESFRTKLRDTFEDWQTRFAACLLEAQHVGELSPCANVVLIARFFWMGWEGAVLHAKLDGDPEALDTFTAYFFDNLPTP